MIGYGEFPPPAAARCTSTDNSFRCVGDDGHAGAHWVPLSGGKAWRWGMRGWGCFDPSCIRRPNHDMPHRDGRGCSWWPELPE